MEALRSWLEARDPASGADVLCVSTREAAASGRRIAVQLSPVSEASVEAELDALAPAAPWAVILPRCRGGVDVQRLSVKLAVREARLGRAAGTTRIVAVIGDAASLLALASLPGASPRLVALVADPRPAGAVALLRGLTVLAATAAGVAAIDGPRAGPFDAEAARAEALRSLAEGFRGKIATNPEELAIYDEVFAVGL